MKTLIIDIDECLVEKAMLVRVNEFLGTNYVLNDLKESGFYAQDMIKDPVQKAKFFDWLFTTDFYKDVPCKDGVHEVLPKLNDKFKVLLCSDFVMPGQEWRCDRIISNKYELIKREFPYMHPTQFIFMHDKKTLKADIQIDDKVKQLSPFVSQRILYTTWHNEDIKDAELQKQKIIRMNSWKEIAKYLGV